MRDFSQFKGAFDLNCEKISHVAKNRILPISILLR